MPYVLFIVGPAGSGKSTSSQLIAQRLGATYVDKDTVVTGFTEALLSLAGTDPQERDNNTYYQDHVMELEYETILKVATDNLLLGRDVVLDAPFGRYLAREDYLREVARRHGWSEDVQPVVVHVAVEGESIRQRLLSRGLERDAWKLAHWDQFWATAGHTDCAWEGAEHLSLDNTADQPDVAAVVSALVAKRGSFESF